MSAPWVSILGHLPGVDNTLLIGARNRCHTDNTEKIQTIFNRLRVANLLGIDSAYQEPAACLLRDGDLIAFDEEEPADLATHVAHRLERGQPVAWFQGRQEIGPRALGNRSILCDPTRFDGRNRLNARVKQPGWQDEGHDTERGRRATETRFAESRWQRFNRTQDPSVLAALACVPDQGVHRYRASAARPARTHPDGVG